MNVPRARRWPRQLEALFWKRGEDGSHRGVLSNISLTGAFVRSSTLWSPGTRLRVQVSHDRDGFVVEAVVARAQRMPPELQLVRPSGMGIRFLRPEDLVEELLPNLATFVPTDNPPRRPEPPAAFEAPEVRTAVATEVPPRAPAPPPSPPGFTVRFRDRQQFRSAFERDIVTGGLFVPTPEPPPLETMVTVEVAVAGAAAMPVRIEARVVHRQAPPAGEPAGPNLLVGMGVQLLDVERSVERLRGLLGGS